MTEHDLEPLVHLFYARVRQDRQLAPVFEAAVQDWPGHLETLTSFWSSVMLTSGRYKGNPMARHLRHAARIEPAMFDRWLHLWGETARERLAPGDAAAIIAKAERIAESLKRALTFQLDPRPARAPA